MIWDGVYIKRARVRADTYIETLSTAYGYKRPGREGTQRDRDTSSQGHWERWVELEPRRIATVPSFSSHAAAAQRWALLCRLGGQVQG
jgi:hypothetical protein